MRRPRRPLLAAAAAFVAAFACVLAVRSAARAEDPDAPARLRLRALDYSAMIEEFERGNRSPDDVPLANRKVQVLVLSGAAGGAARQTETSTGPDGRFELPLDGMAKGDRLQLRIDADAGGGRTFASEPIDPFRPHGAETAAFYRVGRGPTPIALSQLFLTVRRVAADEGAEPWVRINVIAAVANETPEIWMGSEGVPALELPIPPGFQVITVQRSGEDVRSFRTASDRDGRPVLQIDGLFYPAIRGPEPVRVIATGPWSDAAYDLTFRSPYPIGQYLLNLEDGAFSVVAAEDGERALENHGANPEVEGSRTTAHGAADIAPGTLVGARFRAGHAIHPRVWVVIGVLSGVVVGAALLGRALRTSRRGAGTAGPAAPAPALDDEAAGQRLRELDRRLERGEITSFEHAARSAEIARLRGGGHGPTRRG